MIGEFLLFDLSIFMKMLGSFILKIIFSLNNIVSCKKVCPIQIHGGIRIWKNLTTYLQKTKYYLNLRNFYLLTFVVTIRFGHYSSVVHILRETSWISPVIHVNSVLSLPLSISAHESLI